MAKCVQQVVLCVWDDPWCVCNGMEGEGAVKSVTTECGGHGSVTGQARGRKLHGENVSWGGNQSPWYPERQDTPRRDGRMVRPQRNINEICGMW